MSEFLLFTIYAPLASWGEIAVGEARGSWDRPSRSAILGLIGAALGIDRADQEAQDALGGYGIAVRLDAAGSVLSDYHTAQTVAASAVKKAKPRTRAALLDAGERETILSRRAYRQDAVATVAIWARPGARWTLAEVAEALRQPTFTLYAGRKSNPLGAPLNPTITVARSIAEAFGARPPAVPGVDTRQLLAGREWGREVAHDEIRTDDGFASGLAPLRRDTRRDVPVHRRRWQFMNRTVDVGLLNPSGAGSTQVESGGAS